ncbi:hypothetical protein DSO57_1025348 [Entomophthora muscae]|uniref:Uncharacterized protein n=1 Tax=Entomophthora muscae TaxID=34485 RepID=A0ACC2U0J3_9FUNG|nr:hypothetical protein DSO57_1025348 [Entomophthora muscae]
MSVCASLRGFGVTPRQGLPVVVLSPFHCPAGFQFANLLPYLTQVVPTMSGFAAALAWKANPVSIVPLPWIS